ncbi:MAG: ACP S-malonyltransferase [Bacillota bacterium]|nr:ACP S-malonyltransferase [Bacillota bacterium]HHU60646.1 ACP S-malonyltransferase [Natronincola sp.]
MSASSLVCAFPGQGIQKPGMADGIRETGVWKFFERANDILDYDLGKLCLEGPAETLSRTVYAQPAIFVTSYAIWELYKSDYEPDYLMGHSLGEITALVAAGAFSFEEGVKLVQKRGTLMEHTGLNGGMSAILGLDLETVHELVKQVTSGFVQVSNENSPGQTVVSGDEQGLESLAVLAKEQGAKRVVRLNVSGPFHSKLMESVAEKFEEVVNKLEIQTLHTPVISNDGENILRDPEQVRKSLVTQIIKPVRFIASIEKLVDLGVDDFVEISPTQLLIPLVRRIDPRLKTTLVKDGGI